MRIDTFVVFSFFLLSIYPENVKCSEDDDFDKPDSLESQGKNEAIGRKLKEAIQDILINYQTPKDLKLKSTFTLSIALPAGIDEAYITDVVNKTFENILSTTFAPSRTGFPLSVVNFRLKTYKNEKGKNDGVRTQNILVTFDVPNIDSNGECVTSDNYKNDTWCSGAIKWNFAKSMKNTRMKHIQRMDKGFSFDFNDPLWAHLRSWMKKEISSQEKPHSKQVSLSLTVTGRPYSTYEEWLIMTMHIDDQIRSIEKNRDIKYLAQPTSLNSKKKTFSLRILLTPTNQKLKKEFNLLKSICEKEMIPQLKKHFSNMNFKFITMFNAIDTTRQKVRDNTAKLVLRIFERGSKLKIDESKVNQIFKDIKKKHHNIHFISYYRQRDMKNSDFEYLILSFALPKSENNPKENISTTTPKPKTTGKGSYGTTTINTTHKEVYNITTPKTLNTTEETIYTTEKNAYTNTSGINQYDNTTDLSTITTDEGINSNRNEESTHTYTTEINTFTNNKEINLYENTTDKDIDTATSPGTTYTITPDESTYATEMSTYSYTADMNAYENTTAKTTSSSTTDMNTYENTSDKATDTGSVTDTTHINTYTKTTDEGTYTYTAEISTFTNTSDMNTYENTTDVGSNAATPTNAVDLNIYFSTTDMTTMQDSSRADEITTVDYNNGSQGSIYTISLIETTETITTDEVVSTDTPISNTGEINFQQNNDTDTESSAVPSNTTESNKQGKEFIQEIMEQEVLPIVESIYPLSRTNLKISQVEDNTTSLCKLDIFEIVVDVVVDGKLNHEKGKTLKKIVDDSLEKHTNIIVACAVYSDKNYVYSIVQMLLRMKIAKPNQTCKVPKELKEKACWDSKYITVSSPSTGEHSLEDIYAIDGENLPLSDGELLSSKETGPSSLSDNPVFEGGKLPLSEEVFMIPGGEKPSPEDQSAEEFHGGQPPILKDIQVISGGKPPKKTSASVISGGKPPLKAKSAVIIPGGRPPLKTTKKHL